MADDAEPLAHGVIIDERGHQVLRGYNTKKDVPKSVRDSLKLGTYLETRDGGVYKLQHRKHNKTHPEIACLVCNPCQHKNRIRMCLLCKLEGVKGGGTNLCDPHGRLYYGCKRCTHDRQARGYVTRYCHHLFKRHECGPCKGRKICTTVGCHLRAWEKGDGLCLICFLEVNEGHVLAKAHRAKETDVVARLKRLCPDLPFLYNKCIPTGTSRRRPDMFLDLGPFVLVTKNSIADRPTSTNTRIQNLHADAKGRPLVVIRFNPDQFLDAAGKVVESCWAKSASGVTCVVDETVWLERMAVLPASIRHVIKAGKPKYAITVLKLYYNGFSSADPYHDTSSLTAREANNDHEIDEVALNLVDNDDDELQSWDDDDESYWSDDDDELYQSDDDGSQGLDDGELQWLIDDADAHSSSPSSAAPAAASSRRVPTVVPAGAPTAAVAASAQVPPPTTRNRSPVLTTPSRPAASAQPVRAQSLAAPAHSLPSIVPAPSLPTSTKPTPLLGTRSRKQSLPLPAPLTGFDVWSLLVPEKWRHHGPVGRPEKRDRPEITLPSPDPKEVCIATVGPIAPSFGGDHSVTTASWPDATLAPALPARPAAQPQERLKVPSPQPATLSPASSSVAGPLPAVAAVCAPASSVAGPTPMRPESVTSILNEVTARLETLDLSQTVDVMQSMRTICSSPNPSALNVSHRRALLVRGPAVQLNVVALRPGQLVALKDVLNGMQRASETAGPGV